MDEHMRHNIHEKGVTEMSQSGTPEVNMVAELSEEAVGENSFLNASNYANGKFGGFVSKRRSQNRVQKMRWTAEKDRKILMFALGREICGKEYEKIAALFDEKPTPKSVQERLTKLRAEQKLLLAQLNMQEPPTVIQPIPGETLPAGSPLKFISYNKPGGDNDEASARKKRKVDTAGKTIPSTEQVSQIGADPTLSHIANEWIAKHPNEAQAAKSFGKPSQDKNLIPMAILAEACNQALTEAEKAEEARKRYKAAKKRKRTEEAAGEGLLAQMEGLVDDNEDEDGVPKPIAHF